MKLMCVVLIFFIHSMNARAEVCPHESISTKLFEDSALEIYRENFLGADILTEYNIKELHKIYATVAAYFPSVQNLKVSISLISESGFLTSYPELNTSRWGFSVILNKFCNKKIIFLRINESTVDPNTGSATLPPSFYYNYTHELFHVFRYELDPNNFEKNFWAEEGMADHAAYKLSNKKQAPTKFIVPYLFATRPIKLFGNRADYKNYQHYGQSFLFFDFLERRLAKGYDMQSVYTTIDPTMENLARFFNTSSVPTPFSHPSNIFLGFTDKDFYGNTLSESMYIEFVMKLLVSNHYAFYDSTVTRKSNHPAETTILPSGYSFANVQINNFSNPEFNPTLVINGNKIKAHSPTLSNDINNSNVQAFVVLRRYRGRPFSIYTYDTFFRYLKENRYEVSRATLVLFNLTDKDISYSFQE